MTLLIITMGVAISGLMFYPNMLESGVYLNSAHGNTSYGVNRIDTFNLGYSKANCAHCHEQHALINGSEPNPVNGNPSKWCLFADNFSGKTTKPYSQSDNVCFYCHISTNTLQSPSFSNYSYSITFGGNPDTDPNNISNTFNSTSYHNQYDVFRFITGLSGSHPNFSNFPSDSNPCSGCHNVHIAKRSCGKPIGYDPTKSAISRPSDHSNLWGDDASERLKPNFTTSYQAPYWYGSTNYEPNNSTTYDGTNLPDYNTFCIDCHNATNTIYSTTLGRNLKKIDWVTIGGETGGDKHGKNVATDTTAARINLRNPYLGVWTTAGLVLACTDCHEPHGAPNLMLIRKEVNGSVLEGAITNLSSGQLMYLCNRCHTASNSTQLYDIHHGDTGAPYDNVMGCGKPGGCHGGNFGSRINCDRCHFHGGDDDWILSTTQSEYHTNRRTF